MSGRKVGIIYAHLIRRTFVCNHALTRLYVSHVWYGCPPTQHSSDTPTLQQHLQGRCQSSGGRAPVHSPRARGGGVAEGARESSSVGFRIQAQAQALEGSPEGEEGEEGEGEGKAKGKG